MTDESLRGIDILSEFGLTETQAKVFIAATQLVNPTVAELAEASEVRREEVYRLLPDLEKMGLIERLLGKPLRLKTPNPKSSISTLVKLEREKAKDRISELSRRSRDLLQQLDYHGVDVDSEDEAYTEFTLIKEKESIRTELDNMISKSVEQVDLLLSRPDMTWVLSTQGEALKDALERGVRIRIMSEPPAGRDRLPKILQRRFPNMTEMPLKYILNPMSFYLIVDQTQILLITSGAHHLPGSTCLWTNNESLVMLTYRDFESRWHESVHWKTVEGISLSVSPKGGLDGGTSHVHKLFLYQSSDVKNKVLFNFLKQRLDAGYMAFYVCSEESIEDVRNAMIKAGFDAKLIKNEEVLQIIDWSSWFLENDTFSADRAIDIWDDLFFKAQDKGLKGFAAVTEMQFFFDRNIIESLEEYENLIHNLLEGQMEFKCAYDEQTILNTKSPLQLYARLLGYHTTLLTEEKGHIARSKTRQ